MDNFKKEALIELVLEAIRYLRAQDKGGSAWGTEQRGIPLRVALQNVLLAFDIPYDEASSKQTKKTLEGALE